MVKELPIIAQKCNQWDKLYIDRCQYSDIDFIAKYSDDQFVQLHDILINSTGGGTVGRTGFVDNSIFELYSRFVADSHVTVVRPFASVSPRYVYFYLISPYIQIGLEDRCSGSTNQIELGTSTIGNYLLPLPPYKEQERIISIVNDILPKVIIYGNSQDKLNSLNQQIRLSLKKSILQEAIQGRLVPQDSNDEPASVLLERIRTEKERLIKEKKIKRDKNESIIYKGDDNSYYERIGSINTNITDLLPFEIPESWAWCHLPSIGRSDLGKTMDKAKNSGTLVGYLCSINVYWNNIDLSILKLAQFNKLELAKYSLRKNDLLVCEGGDVGRAAIWNDDKVMYYQNALHRVRLHNNINVRYLLYTLLCYKCLGIIDKASKGMTIKHFTQSALYGLYIPLPPYNEQQRIVDQIEELFQLV